MRHDDDTCPECDGAGTIECDECGGYDGGHGCNVCSEEGVQECPCCDGMGTIPKDDDE